MIENKISTQRVGKSQRNEPQLSCPITGCACEGDLSYLCEDYGCARKGGLSPHSHENESGLSLTGG